MVSIQSIGVVNVCLVRSLGSFKNTPGALVLGPVVDHLFGAVPLLGGEIWSIPRCFSSNTRKTRSQSAIQANSSSNTRKRHRYRQKCQLPSRIWRMGASGKPQKTAPCGAVRRVGMAWLRLGRGWGLIQPKGAWSLRKSHRGLEGCREGGLPTQVFQS